MTGPDKLSRLSTFFRIILAIPLLIFLAILGGSFNFSSFSGGNARTLVVGGGGIVGALLLAHWISILLRGRPIGWMWGTLVAIQRFSVRAYSYLLLITDRYPPFEGDWFVQYEVERPERISRKQLVIWKTLTSIPHFFLLAVIGFAVAACEVFAWFAILFTGRFPVGLRDFVAGWMRWGARVTAYWMSLRDEFPPYSLSKDAGPGSRTAQTVSGFAGIGVIAVLVAVGVAAFTALGGTTTAHVSYSTLTNGQRSTVIDVSNAQFDIESADDNYMFAAGLFEPESGDRFVRFDVSIRDGRLVDMAVNLSDFRLKDSEGHSYEPKFVSLAGLLPPRSLASGQTRDATLIFDIPHSTRPARLRYSPSGSLKTAEFVLD